MPEHPLDIGPGEELLEHLLAETPTASATEFTALVTEYATAYGLEKVEVYLVDLQQRYLLPMSERLPSLEIDASLAGWAYRTASLRVAEASGGGMSVWLPLVDGVERVGVLRVRTASLDAARLRRCRTLAALIAMVITSKRGASDTFVQRTRTAPMQLAAEMLRAFLPPRTIGNRHVVSTAVLEPAYEIGGDAFDHSLTPDTLYTTILDSMGHDLSSGLATSVAVAGCRNARRSGAALPQFVESVDDALGQWLPEQFCTGVVCQLDLAGGLLQWINCGHPPPLLIRGRRVLDGALVRPEQAPMGLPAHLAAAPRQVHETTLEPGDQVLLYTDGVTEARMRGGAEFGLHRFTDSIIRATTGGELPPETLRRLIHAVLEANNNRLRDDATILLFAWQPQEV